MKAYGLLLVDPQKSDYWIDTWGFKWETREEAVKHIHTICEWYTKDIPEFDFRIEQGKGNIDYIIIGKDLIDGTELIRDRFKILEIDFGEE